MSGAGSNLLWIGVDLGTQSAKVSIVEEAGIVVASASAALRSSRDGVRHEQDPFDWVRQSRSAMASAIGTLSGADRARIAGMAICATSGTITTANHAGKPLSMGIMYDDARAVGFAEEASAADPELWARLGYRIQPTWALPKMMWSEREGLAPGVRFAAQADVVAAAVVGEAVASDWSHSLKFGYDLIGTTWPMSALERLGIYSALLPQVVAPGTELGRSSREWQESTGLPAGTPVFAGMTDGCAAQIGAGTLRLGDWHTVIGTTLVVKGVSDQIVVDDSGAVYSHRAPHDGLWLPGGASNVGAGVLTTLFPDHDLEARTARVAEAYRSRLHTIPVSYPVVGRGERFPVVQPDALGFVVTGNGDLALSEAHAAIGGDVLLASILLGIACVERLSVATMSAAGVPVDGTFSSSGGGTRNRWWTQLRADLLGRPISIPLSAEGSVGMAILAAWAGQRLVSAPESLPAVAARMSLVSEIVHPNTARRIQLDDRYHHFRASLDERGWLAS